jgi:hypothetical protein
VQAPTLFGGTWECNRIADQHKPGGSNPKHPWILHPFDPLAGCATDFICGQTMLERGGVEVGWMRCFQHIDAPAVVGGIDVADVQPVHVAVSHQGESLHRWSVPDPATYLPDVFEVQSVGAASHTSEIAAVAETVRVHPARPAPAVGEPPAALHRIPEHARRANPVTLTLVLRLQHDLTVFRPEEKGGETAEQLGTGLLRVCHRNVTPLSEQLACDS